MRPRIARGLLRRRSVEYGLVILARNRRGLHRDHVKLKNRSVRDLKRVHALRQEGTGRPGKNQGEWLARRRLRFPFFEPTDVDRRQGQLVTPLLDAEDLADVGQEVVGAHCLDLRAAMFEYSSDRPDVRE